MPVTRELSKGKRGVTELYAQLVDDHWSPDTTLTPPDWAAPRPPEWTNPCENPLYAP